MTDEKRLRGEQEHKITKGEIDAWNRGRDDAVKNKRLILQQLGMSPEKAIRAIKLYAALGDLHYISTKLDMTLDAVRRLLQQFNVNSIEDAKALARDGIVAEFDAAHSQQAAALEQASKIAHQEAQERLLAQEAINAQQERTDLEVDQKREERRQEAIEKNKQDRIRQLISERIDPNTKTSDFRVPINRIGEFKSLLHHGVSQLQRRFGGTKEDIVNEIRRLAPHIDISLLRP